MQADAGSNTVYRGILSTDWPPPHLFSLSPSQKESPKILALRGTIKYRRSSMKEVMSYDAYLNRPI